MPIPHLLLILLVVVIWGVNFLFVKIGLEEISPLLLCALRFILASIPAIFFIKRPKEPFKIVVAYGLVVFALQFGLLFLGMHVGMTPGMASLIMQVQVFFSMFFAVIFLGEQPRFFQVAGALVAFAGIGLVAFHFDDTISIAGFLLILAASASWGFGTLISKKVSAASLISVVVWGSFIASFPMLLLALLFEGPGSFVYTYEHISWRGAGALMYIVYASTWVGYGAWNWLVNIYPIGIIAPFTLLVPVVGIISSIIILGDPFETWQIMAGILVISGLCINLLSSRLLNHKKALPSYD
jgi:O-acetylserine/cysteine efflux transporter